MKLIDDFFYNRISAGNIEEAIKILLKNSKDGDIDELMKNHWGEKNLRQMPNEEEFNILLGNIHHRINLIEENKNREQHGKSLVKKRSVKMISKLIKVAAILFIRLLLSSLFYFTKQINRNNSISYCEVYTPMAARTKFVLPDNTIVWLNSGSTLKYPRSFAGRTREVSLTGEGYFEVAKNLKAPFIVKTAEINITALGTSFNVMAYPDDQTVKATLVTGLVKVEKIDPGSYLYLKPSCQFVLDNNTGEMVVSKVDTRFYTSWKDNKLIFRDEPMELVARKLERWFNCKIYIQDEDLKNFRYTGNIEMETLRELLELISITTPVKSTYKQETREIWLESR